MALGVQATQSCHALQQFVSENFEINREWCERSNYLALLSVKDEQELLELIEKASRQGIVFSIFFEPDLAYAVTAVAFAPGKASKKLLSNVGLALKEKT